MQIEATQTRRSRVSGEGPSPAEVTMLREKENLTLSRIRVVRELETSKNPRYLQLLERELKALEARIGKLS